MVVKSKLSLLENTQNVVQSQIVALKQSDGYNNFEWTKLYGTFGIIKTIKI